MTFTFNRVDCPWLVFVKMSITSVFWISSVSVNVIPQIIIERWAITMFPSYKTKMKFINNQRGNRQIIYYIETNVK